MRSWLFYLTICISGFFIAEGLEYMLFQSQTGYSIHLNSENNIPDKEKTPLDNTEDEKEEKNEDDKVSKEKLTTNFIICNIFKKNAPYNTMSFYSNTDRIIHLRPPRFLA